MKRTKFEEFSNSQREIPKIEGDRQEAQPTYVPKIWNKSIENRKGFIYQEHEDLIIVLNIHRTKGNLLPLLLPAQYQKPNQGEWKWEWAELWMV